MINVNTSRLDDLGEILRKAFSALKTPPTQSAKTLGQVVPAGNYLEEAILKAKETLKSLAPFAHDPGIKPVIDRAKVRLADSVLQRDFMAEERDKAIRTLAAQSMMGGLGTAGILSVLLGDSAKSPPQSPSSYTPSFGGINDSSQAMRALDAIRGDQQSLLPGG